MELIGSRAFGGCSNLTTVNFNAVECYAKLGDIPGQAPLYIPRQYSAFYQSNPGTVHFGSKVKVIPARLFDDNRVLTTLTLPVSLEYIDDYAFHWCLGLDTNIPATVEHIGEHAFDGCALTSVTLPESLEYIGEYAFSDCTGLKTINLNAVNCTTIGNVFYKSSTNVTEVNIGSKVTVIPDNVFSETKINSIIIPESVISIGAGVFGYCTDLKSVTIPESLKSIGDGAFYQCTGLESVTFPKSLETIGSYAISGCTKITSITIPESVTSIGDNAFRACTGLTTVNYNAVECYIETFGGGSYGFHGCTNISEFNIGNKVKLIPSYLFSGLTKLETVTISESVEIIESRAFYQCLGLKSITIGNSVSIIGDAAFYFCSGLSEITIPESVQTIGFSAFYGCTGLRHVTIPASAWSIGTGAFWGCTYLSSVDNYATEPQRIFESDNIFTNTGIRYGVLRVPAASIEKYRAADVWKQFLTIEALPGGEIVNAQTPEITAQPQSAVVSVNTPVTLSVTAGVTDGGTLSYQWYSNTEYGNSGGMPVGANGNTFTPPTAAACSTFYYVEVKNTNMSVNGVQTATAISSVAAVIVNEGDIVDAQTPVITAQPQSVTVSLNTPVTLSVTASVTDGGTLSYQWIVMFEGAVYGITGATAATYSPDTDEEGAEQYGVLVYNTNTSVNGNQTAHIQSDWVTVTVTASTQSPVYYTELDYSTQVVVGGAPAEGKFSQNELLRDFGSNGTRVLTGAAYSFAAEAGKTYKITATYTAPNVIDMAAGIYVFPVEKQGTADDVLGFLGYNYATDELEVPLYFAPQQTGTFHILLFDRNLNELNYTLTIEEDAMPSYKDLVDTELRLGVPKQANVDAEDDRYVNPWNNTVTGKGFYFEAVAGTTYRLTCTLNAIGGSFNGSVGVTRHNPQGDVLDDIWVNSSTQEATITGDFTVNTTERMRLLVYDRVRNSYAMTILVEEVTASTVPVTGVTLNKNLISLLAGGSETLIATVAPANATNRNVLWSSSNTSVATVINGTVTAVSPGIAVIIVSAQDGGFVATCTVAVTASAESTVEVSGTVAGVPAGTEVQLYAATGGTTKSGAPGGYSYMGSTATNAAGYYNFDHLPPGVYIVIVIMEGKESEPSNPISLADGETGENVNFTVKGGTVTPDGLTGTEDIWSIDLKIYPNPFTNELRIRCANAGAGHLLPLRITNAAGVIVHAQMITGADEIIHLEHLPAGLYFFTFENDGKARTVKAVKN